jgi:hypothetical protein
VEFEVFRSTSGRKTLLLVLAILVIRKFSGRGGEEEGSEEDERSKTKKSFVAIISKAVQTNVQDVPTNSFEADPPDLFVEK